MAFLAQADPIFSFLTNRQMIFFAAVLKFTIALFLFSSSSSLLKIGTITWIATIFLVYHIGIWSTGYLGPCKCLGGSLDWLTKSQPVIKNVPKVLIAYLLCSYLFSLTYLAKRFRLIATVKVLIISVFLFVGHLSYAQEFEATGKVDYAAYNNNGSIGQHLHYDFTVAVSNNQWFIKAIWPKSYSAEHGCNGKSVFGIIYDPSLTPTNVPTPGNINSGTYPLLMDPYNRVLWLAFASSYYIDTVTNNFMPAPWTDPFNNPRAYAYKVQIERFRKPPKLPAELTFIADKGLLSTAATNVNLDNPFKEDIASLSEIPVGFVGGKFLTTGTTNYNGLEVPVKFEMMQYAPDGFPVVAKWSGRVTKLSPLKKESFLPKIPERGISVADYRFRDKEHNVRYINYNLTNGNWLAENDPALRHQFMVKIGRQTDLPKQYVSRTLVAVILTLLFVIPPFVFLSFKMWGQKKTQQKG